MLGPWSEVYDDGTYMREFIYRGNAGETVNFQLESADFDAYLLLFSEANEILVQDDDSRGGTDSLISFELPYSGVYYLVVNTVFAAQEGRYTLTVEPTGTNPDDGEGP